MARGRKSKQKSVKKSNNSRFHEKSDNSKKKKPKFKSVYKHIQRNQEAEDELRRSKLVEKKYESKLEAQQVSSSESEEEVDPFTELLQTLDKSNKKRKAIESSEDEDEELDDEEEIENQHETEFDEDEVGEDEEEDIDAENSLNGDTLDSEVEEEEEVEDLEDNTNDTASNPENEEENKRNDGNMNDESAEETEEEFDEEVEAIDEQNIEHLHRDPFVQFLDYNITSELLESLMQTPRHTEKLLQTWTTLGKLQIEIPRQIVNDNAKKKKKTLLSDNEIYAVEGQPPSKINPRSIDLKHLCIKSKLHSQIAASNKENLENYESSKILTNLQSELFAIMNNYQDLYFPQRNIEQGEEIRHIYCLHALNHILKTRSKVLHHNAKLNKLKESNKNTIITPEYCRDQGLSRPKVLIILPFRESALRTVNLIISMLYGNNYTKHVLNYKRFLEEFQGDNLYFSKRNPKPDDYGATFAGNTDDTFRIGISLTKQCCKLYSKYAMSDIIIASPLGLRLTIGAVGEADRDFDFMASIEILIMDQAELFLAQNWDHLLHVLKHLHLQPQSTSNTGNASSYVKFAHIF